MLMLEKHLRISYKTIDLEKNMNVGRNSFGFVKISYNLSKLRLYSQKSSDDEDNTV